METLGMLQTYDEKQATYESGGHAPLIDVSRVHPATELRVKLKTEP